MQAYQALQQRTRQSHLGSRRRFFFLGSELFSQMSDVRCKPCVAAEELKVETCIVYSACNSKICALSLSYTGGGALSRM